MTTDEKVLRALLQKVLDWEDAHVGFDTAVAGVPPRLRGRRPAGAPHSAWELVEHIRLAQADILDFCVNPKYKEQRWPDDYWPSSRAPQSEAAWKKSVSGFRRDRRALQRLAADETFDLASTIPHGSGQTYLRELLLVADHTAHHLGQLVLVRQLLGIWKPKSVASA